MTRAELLRRAVLGVLALLAAAAVHTEMRALRCASHSSPGSRRPPRTCAGGGTVDRLTAA